MFRLQQSVISRTCNNEHRMYLRWFVWHLGNFPAIQSLFRNATSCTEAEDGHLELFYKSSQGHRLETMLQKAHVHKLLFFFFLYCSVDSLPTGLATHLTPTNVENWMLDKLVTWLRLWLKKHCHIWLYQTNKHASGKQHCLWGLRSSGMLHAIDGSWLPLFWD